MPCAQVWWQSLTYLWPAAAGPGVLWCRLPRSRFLSDARSVSTFSTRPPGRPPPLTAPRSLMIRSSPSGTTWTIEDIDRSCHPMEFRGKRRVGESGALVVAERSTLTTLLCSPFSLKALKVGGTMVDVAHGFSERVVASHVTERAVHVLRHPSIGGVALGA